MRQVLSEVSQTAQQRSSPDKEVIKSFASLQVLKIKNAGYQSGAFTKTLVGP